MILMPPRDGFGLGAPGLGRSSDCYQSELTLPDAAHVLLLRGCERARFDSRAGLFEGALEQVAVALQIAGAERGQA
jgi:hypothetical protein